MSVIIDLSLINVNILPSRFLNVLKIRRASPKQKQWPFSIQIDILLQNM